MRECVHFIFREKERDREGENEGKKERERERVMAHSKKMIIVLHGYGVQIVPY